MAENIESILILDFLDLIHEWAAAVSETAHPCCPAFFLGTDLLLPVFHPAVLCPVWGEPGSAGLDRPKTELYSPVLDDTCSSKCCYLLSGRFLTAQVYSKPTK